jgi:hypothetical protein
LEQLGVGNAARLRLTPRSQKVIARFLRIQPESISFTCVNNAKNIFEIVYNQEVDIEEYMKRYRQGGDKKAESIEKELETFPPPIRKGCTNQLHPKPYWRNCPDPLETKGLYSDKDRLFIIQNLYGFGLIME